MKAVNLTPHPLHILGEDGKLLLEVKPSGTVARIAPRRTRQEALEIGGTQVPVFSVSALDIEGLPEPREDAIYVVSSYVEGQTTRPDVFAPGRLVRDDGGNVIGCVGLKQR